MNYEEALDIFENAQWTEKENALFYYRWFGEETLAQIMRSDIEDYQEHFIKIVADIKKKEAKQCQQSQN